MKTTILVLVTGLLVLFLMAACQPAATPTLPAGAPGGQFANNPDFQTRIASNPDMQTRIASGGGPGGFAPGGFAGNGTLGAFGARRGTATATAAPVATSTPQPSPTPTSATAPAVQAAQDYFALLEKNDFEGAARLVSAFSLRTSKQTAGDVTAALAAQKQQGAAWSGLKVVDSQAFTDNTVLVHVTYQLSSNDKNVNQAKDELWPFRFENNQWRYNWGNLVDFKTLSAPTKVTAGLTITPLMLIRYSDRITLTVLAQNGTNETIVIGSANQVLATFHFGDKSVEATNTRYIFNSLRSYPSVTIDVRGLYTTYPDSVDLVKGKTSTYPAWFTFSLAE